MFSVYAVDKKLHSFYAYGDETIIKVKGIRIKFYFSNPHCCSKVNKKQRAQLKQF